MPTTADTYRKDWRLRGADLDAVPLADLTPAQVSSWWHALPASSRTSNVRCYDLLKSVLADAVEDELIEKNPCRVKGAGKPPSGRKGVALTQATLLSTFPEIGTEAERAAFQRVSRQARLTRYGLDCYGYALLALGQVDLVIEAGLQPYDIVAPIAVIEAAGGIVTDWQGGPAHGGGQVLAAATPELHAAALALLRG